MAKPWERAQQVWNELQEQGIEPGVAENPITGEQQPVVSAISYTPPPKRENNIMSVEDMIRQNVVGDMGSMDAFMVGAGREVSKLKTPFEFIMDPTQEGAQRRAEEREFEKKSYGVLQDEFPFATTGGEIAPWMVLPQGTFSKLPAKIAEKSIMNPGMQKFLQRTAAIGERGINKPGYSAIKTPVFQAMSKAQQLNKLPAAIKKSQAVEATGAGLMAGAIDPDLNASDAALQSLLAQQGFKFAGKFISKKGGDMLNKADSDTIDWARRKGYKTMPGERSGHRGTQQLDQAFKRQHRTTDWAQGIEYHNATKNNRIISKLIGNESDEISPDYLLTQSQRIGDDLDKLVRESEPTITAPITAKLMRNLDDYKRVYIGKDADINADPGYKAIMRYTNRLLDSLQRRKPGDARKMMSGESFEQISKDIQKYTKNAERNGKPEAEYMKNIKEALYDMVDAGGTDASSDAWKKSRQQYAMLKIAEQNTTGGNINPTKLYHYLNRTNKQNIVGGKDARFGQDMQDMYQMARYGYLQSKQQGASLGVSQAVSTALNDPGAAAAGLPNLLFGKYAKGVGPLNTLMLELYRTGLISGPGILPRTAPDVIGKAGSRYMISGDHSEE